MVRHRTRAWPHSLLSVMTQLMLLSALAACATPGPRPHCTGPLQPINPPASRNALHGLPDE